MELSVVNHDDYFAKIGDDHKFPINKFGELANYLIQNKIVKKFHKPYPCSFETLSYAHSENYISNIKNKTLNKDNPGFINDTTKNNFHRKFMDKYIK